MRDGHGEVDVSHALAAHDGARNLDAALFTNYPFISNAAVFAAVTLVVALGAENLFVEERVLFGPLGAVVDGLRLGNLAVRPLEYALGAGGDPHQLDVEREPAQGVEQN